MLKSRIIPVLLLKGEGLVKTINFKNPKYIGDPINAVRIFNEKEVDELIFLDINASKLNVEPNYQLLSNISGEAFMPMSYGGGITSLKQIEKILKLGFEKIVINSSFFSKKNLIQEAVKNFGSQSIIGAIDVRKNILNSYVVYKNSGLTKIKVTLKDHIASLMEAGVGEIFINSIDKDGYMKGYDLDLLKVVSSLIKVPLIACGGAGSLNHLKDAIIRGNASAAAAGSLFVFLGPHRAVLINYPDRETIYNLKIDK